MNAHQAESTAPAPLAGRGKPAAVKPAVMRHLEALWTPEWPEVWREMSRTMFTALLAQPGLDGIEPGELAVAAVEQMIAVAELYGGAPVYIASGHFIFAGDKARKIIAEYTGRNLQQVARDHEVSTRRVQQIIGAWQRSQFAARQGTLDL